MSDDIQQHSDAVLRKIGRNIVNFQKLEAVLRALVLSTSANGTLADFQARQAARLKLLKKSSLGNLAKDFSKSVYGPAAKGKPPEPPSDGWVSFSFQAEPDPVAAKEKKRALSALVQERNRLVHSDVGNVDLNSIESCLLACAELDIQNERICAQLEELKTIRNLHIESTQALQAFFDSDEFLRFIGGEQDDA